VPPHLSSPHFKGKEKSGFGGILLLSLEVRERQRGSSIVIYIKWNTKKVKK